MKKEIKIGNRTIGENHQPFIIAEMSGNHNQSLDRAMEIVESAARAGAHALKLQTYTADTITLDINGGDFFISDEQSLWKGESLHNLYQKAYTPWEWHEAIFQRANELGMIAFSSPFDFTAVDFLEELNVPCYKIASFENIDIPLIKKVASTGKPMIISTGMASEKELEEAVEAAHSAGCEDLILLKCTSTYPATAENTNLRTIPDMREKFGVHVGLSDHTMGVGVAVAAVSYGATVVEKHFTLARADGGVDSAFSLEPDELKSLVTETKRAWQAQGRVQYSGTAAEEKSKQFRRSLYVANDIKSGEEFTADNVRSVRPSYGLPPKYYEDILGKKAASDLPKGKPLAFEDII